MVLMATDIHDEMLKYVHKTKRITIVFFFKWGLKSYVMIFWSYLSTCLAQNQIYKSLISAHHYLFFQDCRTAPSRHHWPCSVQPEVPRFSETPPRCPLWTNHPPTAASQRLAAATPSTQRARRASQRPWENWPTRQRIQVNI